MGKFVINTRSLGAPRTGVQRYLSEILRRFPNNGSYRIIQPQYPMFGMSGHLWEQSILPLKASGKLLWSPCNSGPMLKRQQVVTIHDIGPLEHPEWWGKKYSSWYREMVPKLAKSAVHIITVSDSTKERIMNVVGVPENRLSVIHLAAGDEYSTSRTEKSADSIEKLGLADKKYFLSLGSMDPRKNTGTIIKAWSMIQRRCPDHYLVLAGPSALEHVFGTRGSIDGSTVPRVIQLGKVDQVHLPSLYQRATCFISASLYEGFGLPPLEALRSGTRILVSDIDAHREVLSGQAIYFNPQYVEALASEMEEAVKLGVDAFAKRNERTRYARKYSWDRAADKTHALITALQ